MPQFRGGTPAPQFALHVLNTTLDNSTMSVGWTVTPDVLAEVTKQESEGKKSWMMLLTFSAGYRHEERKIVPLRDCIAYLGLRRPGKTRVFGQILCGSKKDVFKTWLAKTRPSTWESKSHFTLEDDGFPLNIGALKEHTVGPAINVDVETPKEAFAPEPPAWERKWVNRLFQSSPAYDQCEYRRRRMFAYTVQPFFALALTCFTGLIQTIGLLGFLVKPARKPWKGMGLTFEDPFGDNIIPNEGLNWVLFPILWWGPALLTWLLLRHRHGHLDLKGITVLGGVAPVAITLFVAWMAYLIKKFCDYAVSEGASTVSAKVGKQIIAVTAFVTEPFVRLGIWFLSTALTDEDILILTTPKQERAAMELRDLPASKRTIKLRFFDFKAKVCRPFAR